MTTKTFRGPGKLYDVGNTRHICDASYHITEKEGSDTRLDITGRLRGIEWQILQDMGGNRYVLHLDDGRLANIVVTGLTQQDLPDSCKIRVNGFVDG